MHLFEIMDYRDQPSRFPEYRPPPFSRSCDAPTSMNAPVPPNFPQNFPPFQYIPPNPVPWNAVPPPPLPSRPDSSQYSSYQAPLRLSANQDKAAIPNYVASGVSKVSSESAYLSMQNLIPGHPTHFESSGTSLPKTISAPHSIYDTNTTSVKSSNVGSQIGYSSQPDISSSFSHPPPFLRTPSNSYPPMPLPNFNTPPPGFAPRFPALPETRNMIPASQISSKSILSSTITRPHYSHQDHLSGNVIASSVDLGHQHFTKSDSFRKVGHEQITEKTCSWNADSIDTSIRPQQVSNLPQQVSNFSGNEIASLSGSENEAGPLAVSSTGSQLTDDLKWIEKWSQSKHLSKGKHFSKPKTLPLLSFRSLLIEAMKLNDQLKDVICKQSNKTTLSGISYDQSEGGIRLSDNSGRNPDNSEGGNPIENDPSSILSIQRRLIEIKDIITDEVVSGIKGKLKKIEKKRKRLKRKRQREYEESQERASIRAQIDQEIDNWQLGILWKQTKLKKEKEIQAIADETLFEVRQKLTEARRCLSLLNNMRKLRNLRKEKASRKGMLFDTNPDVTFEERITAQTDILKRRIDMYELEERTLEVMLETEQEANFEREKKLQKKKDEEKIKKFSKQLHDWLFGEEESLSPSDPLFPYRQYYDIGSHNLAAFIRIRQEWDFYAVPYGTPGGSLIPFGWVKPVQPSSEVWLSALGE